MKYLFSWFTLLVTLVILKEGICIQCWHCLSDIDPDCRDPFSEVGVLLTECKTGRFSSPPESFSCKKTIAKYEDIVVVVRGCALHSGFGISNRTCYEPETRGPYLMYDCYCNNEDGCNAF